MVDHVCLQARDFSPFQLTVYTKTMKTPGKMETFVNGDLSGDFKNGDFENRAFRCVNTQKRKRRAFSAGSHVVSRDKMAVLEAFCVAPIIITHASLINFRWTE